MKTQYLCFDERTVDVKIEESFASHGDTQAILDIVVDEFKVVLAQIGHPSFRRDASRQVRRDFSFELVVPSRRAHYGAASHHDVFWK